MPPTLGFPNPVTVYSKGTTAFHDYVQHYRDETLQWLGLAPAPDSSWRHLAAHFRWLGSTDTKDDCFMTFDVQNITAGAWDSTWTAGDYTVVESNFDAFFAALAASQSSNARLIEYRWYVNSFNDYSNPKPFGPHGSPERVTSKAIVGAGTGAQLTPQVAATITWKHSFPRNWGRSYIPMLSAACVSGSPPRFVPSYCDSWAAAARDLLTGLVGSNFQLVVPITSLGTGGRGSKGGGTPNRRLQNIESITVDDVPDVMRKRRPNHGVYRKNLP